MQGHNGQSKGHGIVLFSTIKDADSAKKQLNGFEWRGRKLEVREDRGVVDHVLQKQAPAPPEGVDALADALQQKLVVQDGAITKHTSDVNTDIVETGANGDAKELGVAVSKSMTPVTPAQPALSRTVHVGNVPFRVRWQDLKDLFRKAGRVVRADVALAQDNRSRGHGTVIYTTEEEAKNAISMTEKDRILQVSEERPAPQPRIRLAGGLLPTDENGDATSSSTHDLSTDGPSYPASRQVFITNLPFQCEWQDLKDLFRTVGTVIRADVALRYDGMSRGFGSVLFATQEDAKDAIAKFNNYELNGRHIPGASAHRI
ncbi:hypothetical protein BGZ83_001134 [Gryganskiella cystojenkinii]|nr:hypothetical protein BGZ83_001134 [Gryganskiella cystojenkinii]